MERSFKTVKFGPETKYVPVIMYGSPRCRLQKIPDVDQPKRNNAFGKIRRKDARMMIFMKRNGPKQKLRMQVNDHPSGTVKHHDNAGYFLCRGKELVSAEIALHYLCYDIRRAVSLVGGIRGTFPPMKSVLPFLIGFPATLAGKATLHYNKESRLKRKPIGKRKQCLTLYRKSMGVLALRKIMLVFVLLLAPALALAGSVGQINQEMGKGEGWVQIVDKSAFPLGETTEKRYGNVDFWETAYGAYPSLDGSTVSVPMAREFARQHLQLPEAELEAFVRFSTTHDAYVNLIEKKPNLGAELPFSGSVMEQTHAVDIFIGTEPSEEELKLAKQNGVKLTVTPVCYDAFVFIVNTKNPVESLTVSQIQDVYSGKTLYWEQLGVEGVEEEGYIEGQAQIWAYTRQRNSGSQTAMDNLVMQGIPMASNRTNFYQVFDMSSLVENIGSFQNADKSIGYTYKFYIDTLYKNDGIKTIAIDGIAPTDENIRSGAYPFATCYYAVTREGESEAFVAWMTSEEGQRVIKQAGYIPYMAGV